MRIASLQKLFQQATSQIRDPKILEQLEAVMEGRDDIILPEILLADATDEDVDEEKSANLAALIREMTVPQKIKTALLGNMVARSILIRDTNWMVANFVLQNPRLSETEIHDFAKNTNLDDQVFRAIANDAEYMKNYSIKLNIVSNPKTPVDVSLKWLKHLQTKDLRNLGRSKGIPQVIVGQCRKLLETRTKKGGD